MEHGAGRNKRFIAILETLAMLAILGALVWVFTPRSTKTARERTQMAAAPLRGVVKSGDVTELRRMFDDDAAVATNPSALEAAIRANNHEIVELLLDEGADVNEGNGRYWTPLTGAIEWADFEMVRILIERGANVEQKGDEEYGSSPLITAIYSCETRTIALLLDSGADPKAEDGGLKALSTAMRELRRDVYMLLVKYGATIESVDQEGRNSLLVDAIHARDADLVADLLDAGADVECALANAATASSTDIVRLLIEEGADIECRDEFRGATPVMLAAESMNHDNLMLLLELGADINAKDGLGRTILMNITGETPLEWVRILLEAGADTTITCNDGRTALEHVRVNCPPSIVEIVQAAHDTAHPDG